MSTKRLDTTKFTVFPLSREDQDVFDRELETTLQVIDDPDRSPTCYIKHPFTKIISSVRMCDNSHLREIWSEDMLYYFSGLLMDRYMNKDIRLGLYRDDTRNGPTQALDCIFHPFFNGNWHLAVYHNLTRRLVFVDCSPNKKETEHFSNESFSRSADLAFLRRVGKVYTFHKYPILEEDMIKMTRVFTKVSCCNAVNVLAIIYGICCTRNILDYFFGIPAKGGYNRFDVSLFYTHELSTFDRHLIDRISLGDPFYRYLEREIFQGGLSVSLPREKTPPKRPAATQESLELPSAKQLRSSSAEKPPANNKGTSPLTNPLHNHKESPHLNKPLKLPNALRVIQNCEGFMPHYRYLPLTENHFLSMEMAEKLYKLMRPDMVEFNEPDVLDSALDFLQKLFSSRYAREKYSECDIMCKDIVNAAVIKKNKERTFDYDEEYFIEDLNIDNESQIFPVFIHQSQLFIVELKHNKKTEFGDTTVNILEVAKKSNTQDILSNHMLKELVSTYAFHKNRKIVKVNTGKLVLANYNLFSMIIMMFYVVAYSIKHQQFLLSHTPSKKNIKDFTDSLLSIAKCIKKRNIQGRDEGYKNLLMSIE